MDHRAARHVRAAIVLGAIVVLVITAITGSPEARRKLAPYGLLKPGVLWLALFYLAPLITLLKALAVEPAEPVRGRGRVRLELRQLPRCVHRLRSPVRTGASCTQRSPRS
jgi:hypothetical protein